MSQCRFQEDLRANVELLDLYLVRLYPRGDCTRWSWAREFRDYAPFYREKLPGNKPRREEGGAIFRVVVEFPQSGFKELQVATKSPDTLVSSSEGKCSRVNRGGARYSKKESRKKLARLENRPL